MVCQERPLNMLNWDISSSLKIHEATTKHYKASWNVRASNCHGQWPKNYDYTADCNGWISDWFIRGGCDVEGARVSWNLATNAVRVTNGNGSDGTNAQVHPSMSKNSRTSSRENSS